MKYSTILLVIIMASPACAEDCRAYPPGPQRFACASALHPGLVAKQQRWVKRTPLPGLVHVVDDDAGFRTAIERRLKKAGYEVATYPSAQHLLDRLPSEIELGCILLNVRIPELSGPELRRLAAAL
jgi:hypothetical protein